MSTEPESTGQSHKSKMNTQDSPEVVNYLRFGAMILTAMVAMFLLTYVNTFQLSHAEFSETRVFMTLLMGGSMAIIMLAFMLGMYKNWKANIAIFLGGLAMLGLGTFLVRSQTTVQDESFMRAMIPHHSIAILTSERSEISDVRVCELQIEIIEAQKREIAEMDWLLEDIDANGVVTTAEEAERRAVPEFQGDADRTCD